MKILRSSEEVVAEEKKFPMAVVFDEDDKTKLLALTELTKTSQADVLRQCLRYVYDKEIGAKGV